MIQLSEPESRMLRLIRLVNAMRDPPYVDGIVKNLCISSTEARLVVRDLEIKGLVIIDNDGYKSKVRIAS